MKEELIAADHGCENVRSVCLMVTSRCSMKYDFAKGCLVAGGDGRNRTVAVRHWLKVC